jgi:nitrogen fixation NifU-like protein
MNSMGDFPQDFGAFGDMSGAMSDFGISSDSDADFGSDFESPDSSLDPQMEQMYQEFILEQSRDPHGKTHFAPDLAHEQADSQGDGDGSNGATGSGVIRQAHDSCLAQSHQFNPTCGDEVTVRVTVSSPDSTDPKITSIQWDGHGCAISQASLSVMHDMVTGQKVSTFRRLRDEFHQLMDSRGQGVSDSHVADDLGDAVAFQGVSRFPMRIKCALLGWEGVRDALAHALAASSDQTK